MPPERRSALERAASLFFGVLLPLTSFAVNEIVDPFAVVRLLQDYRVPIRGVLRWLGYGYSPAVPRFLYPLVLWAVLSLFAELFVPRKRFRPWVRTGLKVGVWTAGLFSLWYAAVIPLALVGAFAYGLGLLGLAPFPTLLTYVFARKANSAVARQRHG